VTIIQDSSLAGIPDGHEVSDCLCLFCYFWWVGGLICCLFIFDWAEVPRDHEGNTGGTDSVLQHSDNSGLQPTLGHFLQVSIVFQCPYMAEWCTNAYAFESSGEMHTYWQCSDFTDWCGNAYSLSDSSVQWGWHQWLLC
jgi:hypothetical protein